VSTSADQSIPHVMRWRDDLARLSERDRLPRVTPEHHREDRTTKVNHFVAIVDDIENFDNPARRHSSLDYFTPNEFDELKWFETHTRLA
jgi:hypothetical protein